MTFKYGKNKTPEAKVSQDTDELSSAMLGKTELDQPAETTPSWIDKAATDNIPFEVESLSTKDGKAKEIYIVSQNYTGFVTTNKLDEVFSWLLSDKPYAIVTDKIPTLLLQALSSLGVKVLDSSGAGDLVGFARPIKIEDLPISVSIDPNEGESGSESDMDSSVKEDEV